MAELKPYPFCRGEAKRAKSETFGHVISCKKCGAKTGYRASKAAATKAWNRRADHISWIKSGATIHIEYSEKNVFGTMRLNDELIKVYLADEDFGAFSGFPDDTPVVKRKFTVVEV